MGRDWAGRPDPAIQIAAQALVGAWVGTRFIGFDWHLLRGVIIAAWAPSSPLSPRRLLSPP